MQKQNLCSITITKYKPQKNKQTVMSKVNILNQDFSTKTICEKWVADITHIPIKK